MDLLEHLAELDAPAPRWVFTLDILAIEEMERAAQAWGREHGTYAMAWRLHQWQVDPWASLPSVPGHFAVVTHAHLGCGIEHSGERCYCVGDDIYRVVCLSCWEATVPSGDVEDHVAAWHDHTWPGWRDLPAVATSPVESGPQHKAWNMWVEKVTRAYPADWGRDGAPVLTDRPAIAARSVPGRSPWGGYDIPAIRRDHAGADWA